MIAFKGTFRRGDSGLDCAAVKRTLRRRGHRAVSTGRLFGPAAAAALAGFQRAHGLPGDGIYGPRTHGRLEPLMRPYERWLYRRARKRTPYVNPFRRASVRVGRIDMGVDYHGEGPIGAIGDAVVTGVGGRGWPGGHYLVYRLLDGPHAGRHVYVAEAIEVAVRVGQRVSAGQAVCYFGPDARPGRYPGIETGWSSPTPNLTRAASTTGYREGQQSPAGRAFARLLRRIGAPAPWTWPGPQYV